MFVALFAFLPHAVLWLCLFVPLFAVVARSLRRRRHAQGRAHQEEVKQRMERIEWAQVSREEEDGGADR